MTRRYKMTVEYDGGPFLGWQFQEDGPSIQSVIEEAIHAFAHEDIRIHGAGRTDKGVHATGQVFHFDMSRDMSAYRAMQAINALVRPHPIAIIDAEIVDGDFHSRFLAKKRDYEYRIVNRIGPLAIAAGRAWHVEEKLDPKAMHDAAQILVGTHDFTTFRAVHCQSKSPVKTLDQLDVIADNENILFYVSARSFLHHQVRSMVGCLKLVGEGKWNETDLKNALDAKNRNALGLNAPAHGLYLTKVAY